MPETTPERKIIDIIPEARWKLIPDAGHVVYLEKPDEFFGSLIDFIQGKAADSRRAGTGTVK